MTNVVEASGLVKTFGNFKAVDDVSFDLKAGEIFGMLGPNGAGKTTTIRMLLDIIRPDAGRIAIFGGPIDEAKKERLGYLPEERGLYQDMTLLDVLVFLASLKGLSTRIAKQRVEERLREVELWDERNLKISALSRGMNQKAQFVATTVHDPDLIVLDEPFSGLDPVNVLLIKELIYRKRDRGAAIIMSTHQMHQVEEMANRIMLVNHGQRVLYGSLDELRKGFAGYAIEVTVKGDFGSLPGVRSIQRIENGHRLVLDDRVTPDQVLRSIMDTPGLTLERYQQAQASLDEIFVKVVGGAGRQDGAEV